MSIRTVLGAVVCGAALTGCDTDERQRRASAEAAALATSSVFETTERYSGDALRPADFVRFFEAHPDYRPDSVAVTDFYQRRDAQFAWILDGAPSASAESFIAFATAVDSTAPVTARFADHVTELYSQSTGGDAEPLCAECAADLELHMTAEFFRVASRKYGGYLRRDLRTLDWFIPRARKDAGQLLDSLATGQMDLSAYEPIHPQVQLLRRGIAVYRAAGAAEPWASLALPRGSRKIEPGERVAVISDIRRRLQLLGDSSEISAGEQFDTTLVRAVRRFQGRHGLQPDAVIGASFLRALNVTPEQRMRTMLVNIERLRWVPEERPPNLLLVNIPEFRLHVYEGGTRINSMDIVVGARATTTVIFSDVVSKIVFSPYWNVPVGITRREVLPAMRKDPSYLATHDMEIFGGSAALPAIRQRPGPKNPLGGVKFLFPNSYDIYLHDTPSRTLFARDMRAGSHGCVRLSRAAELAAYLLRNDAAWTPERIGLAMESGTESSVALTEPWPVMIGYFTAWVDDEGQLNFRDDVYGHDAKLARELFVR